MRITEIDVKDTPPVRLFHVSALTDVVVLAGPNGVGKTRLLQALIEHFQNPVGYRNIRLTIRATAAAEQVSWGKETIDTSVQPEAQKLIQSLQVNRRRAGWKSSVIVFESDRSIQQIQPFAFSWDFADPFEESFSWNATFGGLRSRFQDTIHSIFRKVQGRREQIGRAVEQALRQGSVTVQPAEYPDPLAPFKAAFSQLLAPKQLLDVDLRQQQLRYSSDGQEFPLAALSSGEREVVNIVFDFLLRGPEDCIIFFDEPELHLHPELSFKLLQTLRTIGVNNQFLFCTHSPEIITASLDQSVIFLAPRKDPPENQAVVVREDDETNHALRLLGHSVGIVALGKRLVLIEGASSSIDKQLYGTLLKNRYPSLVLIASGGKGAITSFSFLNRTVLKRVLWGVDFFMLCDRDAVPLSRPVNQLERDSDGHLRVLNRYHVENYFLDSRVLAAVFEQMEPAGSWLRSADLIEARLREIARSLISYAVALSIAAEFRERVGNLDVMPSDVHGKGVDGVLQLILLSLRDESRRIAEAVSEAAVEARVRSLFQEFDESLAPQSSSWLSVFPGKPILAMFASQTHLDLARLKTMYIRTAEALAIPAFAEIVAIFEAFSSASGSP